MAYNRKTALYYTLTTYYLGLVITVNLLVQK